MVGLLPIFRSSGVQMVTAMPPPSFQFSDPLKPSLPSPPDPCPQVSLLIRRELTERAKDFSLILDDVAITELSFSREYTAAVEAKQVGKSMEAGTGRGASGGGRRGATCSWASYTSHLIHSPAVSPAGPVVGGESEAGTATEECAG